MNQGQKIVYLSTISLLALAFAVPTASAQSGLGAGAAGSGAPAAPSIDPQKEAATSTEVIVTAQRRSERLNEVPISMVAVSAAQLDRSGVSNARDLTMVTPGLVFSGNGANAEPAIRGIHSDQTDPGNDPNVAIYVDGVYQANQIANNMDLADIDRVEVLKGPQGTLFGRNATGGAIRVFTKQPSFSPDGILDVGYGSYNDFTVKGFATGPIISGILAGSLSGYYESSDSYDLNIVTGKHGEGLLNKALRGKLLFTPVDNLKIELSASYMSRVDGNATAYEPLNGNTAARLIPGAVFPSSPHEFANDPSIANNPIPIAQSSIFSTSAKIDWDLPSIGTISSITAYNNANSYYTTDPDFSSAGLLDYPIDEKDNDNSEELTFSSKHFGMFQFTTGAYYYHSLGRYDPLVVEGSGQPVTIYGFMSQKTDAYAGFGELSVQPIDRLTIILGLRYSDEHRDAAGSYFVSDVRPSTLPKLGSASFSSATPRATIRYTLPTNDNIYFTYSQGFKSGGFNVSGLSTTPFKPETIDAYEIGLKTSPHRLISGDFSAFYYDYSNQQVQSNVNGFNVTANAASSKIWGADADILIRPVRAFTVTITAAYLHARYDSYQNAVYNVPIANCSCGNNTTTGNLSGGQEPFSPTYTLGISPDYRKDLALGTLDLSAAVYTTAHFYFDNNARVEQPGYTTLALRASFRPANTKLTIYAWGKNVSNARYINTQFIGNLGDGVTYAAPDTFGGGLRYEF